MKSMYVQLSRLACAIGLALAASSGSAQVPSSALHPGGMNAGVPASSAERSGPAAVARRPATSSAQAQSATALRIVDPQDNAQRTRSNFRITIATSAAYANRLATVTVHQQVQAAVPTTAGYTPGYAGFGFPVSKDAKWDVPVSQLLQGWSPPVTHGWFDANLWFENITGSALVEVSFAVPEHAERFSAQTHVTFATIDFARGAPSERPPLQQTTAPRHAPASLGRRP